MGYYPMSFITSQKVRKSDRQTDKQSDSKERKRKEARKYISFIWVL